ncbi:helix-turn-helix domain-containing protein [Enterococcus avium]|uniref:Helix-turn-helix domain-containing protein n=1 Tax=Enterococcus avium TaxID=33945 RepID=A0ABD5F6Q8_ENTAV|nr:helix-turn-helix domain-containing protein [Enterococcus avium]MDT2397074.1 helix-turn-helix domain-containing protein [Enterococcus avium]MDT2434962.1 helix-turn-helix domain-containing protein [Enterococcus avium]MDT2449527.1 helix-turn-helix domain-containing protein [Enterococcus avium]MDT2459133.1 helix-turn-helix domain-containing protein [Enterococcus avium]MDT2469527.1 helix-turn-helix domain-containing protein [Enterococcus avium]
MNVLILTKCVFAEGELIKKLNLLGHEVFCSNRLFEELIKDSKNYPVINYFPNIIFSETISDDEVGQIVKNENIQHSSLFRKATTFSKNHREYENEDVNFLFMDDPLEEIGEKLRKNQVQCQQNSKPNLLSFNIKDIDSMLFLSNQERQVFEILYNAKGRVISREEICKKIWSQVTNSNLAQTSTIVRRIKIKLEDSGFSTCDLQTIWGKGYRMITD